ncbi:MAG: hypothetical protein WB713_03535 [Methyloceanibacter sp.]
MRKAAVTGCVRAIHIGDNYVGPVDALNVLAEDFGGNLLAGLLVRLVLRKPDLMSVFDQVLF